MKKAYSFVKKESIQVTDKFILSRGNLTWDQRILRGVADLEVSDCS